MADRTWCLTAVIMSCTCFGAAIAQQPAPDRNSSLSLQQLAKQARKSVVVITVPDRDRTDQVLGSGFMISEDGLIATNLHVISEGRPIKVVDAQRRQLPVTHVHAFDRGYDLAILRVDPGDRKLPALAVATERIAKNEPVLAIGNPLGFNLSLSSGLVSDHKMINRRGMLQLSMPIERGHSGGPVIDMNAQVHGVVTLKVPTGNVGFAADAASLRSLIDRPNPVPIEQWVRMGKVDATEWQTLFGARWQLRGGRIFVDGAGSGFGGRSLCLSQQDVPGLPYELAVAVRLNDEAGAAGLIFHSDGNDRHYGFYPSNGRLRLTRFDGPTVFTWNVLEEKAAAQYRHGQWNRLKVRMETDKLQCFVNDQLIFESTDRAFTSGRVGLAKFRDTKAQFKHFQIAKSISASGPSAETLQQIRRQIAELPSLAEVTPDMLDELIEARASSNIVEDHAAKLEEQAKRLKQLASDLRLRDLTRRLADETSRQDADVDLLRAALLIAQIDDPDVDVDAYVQQVDRMAAEIVASLEKKRLPDQEPTNQQRLEALNEYLFRQHGFHGSRFDYDHPANSHLNRVIDERVGLPITLSVLYMELGTRVGLDLQGVGLPTHFVVKHVRPDNTTQLIDVFYEGQPMSRTDADELIAKHMEQPLSVEHFDVDKRAILSRMLLNLRNIAEQRSDRESLLRYLEAAVTIDPQAIRERGLRAFTRFETGRKAAAIEDLDWFLENRPAGLDLGPIQEMRERFSQ